MAALAAIGFSSAALLALLGEGLTRGAVLCDCCGGWPIARTSLRGSVSRELGDGASGSVVGFLGGFAGLFLSETLTHSHTHPSEYEHSHKHSLASFVLGLSVYNSADGFALGDGVKAAAVTAVGALDLGVLVHQAPVGGALAAVLVAAQASRGRMIVTAVALGLLIPAAAGLTMALPTPSEDSLGLLLGVAGGVLAYISAAHLLPEVQAERPNRASGLVFFVALVLTTVGLFTFLGD